LAQNVGISRPNPTEKFHVDSGNIKIGNDVWSLYNNSLLKFGDGNYLTIGEDEADDKLTIRAKEVLIRPSSAYNTVPLSIQGSSNYSHFYYGTNEDTYIRGGKSSSNLILGDGGGRTGINVYPQRAMLEQNGVVGTTAAIFGGEGAGISLQRNWPVVGFNHYYNGLQRSMAAGWVGFIALSQADGSFHFDTFGDYGSPGPDQDMSYSTTQLLISRRGDASINGNVYINNSTDGPALKIHNTALTGNNNSTAGIRLETDAGSGYYPWNIFGSAAFYFAYNGVWKSNISSSDGSYYNISDSRFKKEIVNVPDNTLKKIMALRPVKYLMKEEAAGSKNHIGFISQEVEKIYPEIVQESKGTLAMNYSGLIPVLTKGMQEQQQQIEALQSENTAIKFQNKQLQEDFEKLNQKLDLLLKKNPVK
jgi:hypothetical protein